MTPKKLFSEKNSDFFFSFSLFSADFRGARLFLMSKSNSLRFFALDGQVFRSERRLGLIFRFFTVRTSTCGGKARVTEIPEGGSVRPDSPGGKARVTEIPEGGFAPPDPHYNISKKKTSALTVVDATFGRKIEPIEKTKCIEPKFYRSYRSKAALSTLGSAISK